MCDWPNDGTDLHPELPAQRASRVFQRRVVSLPTVVQMAAPHFCFYIYLHFLRCFPATAIRAVKPLCTIEICVAMVHVRANLRLSQQAKISNVGKCAGQGHVFYLRTTNGGARVTNLPAKARQPRQMTPIFRMACMNDVDSKQSLIGKTYVVETVQRTPVQTMQAEAYASEQRLVDMRA